MTDERTRKLEELVRELLLLIGEDPNREGLKETPARVARMWLEELSAGYREDPTAHLKIFTASDAGLKNGIVVVRDIPVRSICEHHLLPFFGYAHIAYVPDGRILGFSKFARIVGTFAKRLQVQERLTRQVADFLYDELKPKGLMVLIDAVHTCALVRGIEEPMYLTTTEVRGIFKKDEPLRREALTLLQQGSTVGLWRNQG